MRRKRQYLMLLILIFVASLLEVVSVGAVLPFLGVLTAPEQVYQHPLMQPFIQTLELSEPSQLVLPLTLLFIIAAVMAGSIRLLLLFVMTRLTYATGADLSFKIYNLTLYQEYSVHVSRNSSEVINGILNKSSTVISSVIMPVIQFISATVLIISIMTALLVIDTIVALTVFIGIGLLYLGIIRYTGKHLRKNSKIIADKSTLMVKSLQEGLGGIREVLIDGSQEFYSQLYRSADLPLRHASGNNAFIGGGPRFVLEAVGMTLIALIAFAMSLKEGGIATAIPILGALALGAQRLLPALQQAYASFSSIRGVEVSLKDVLDLLEQPIPEHSNQPPSAPIKFEREIKLTNLSFRYLKETPLILKNINLSIAKGERIGFMGVTGSGKSTLLDIIMGLLPPTEGKLTIDQKPLNTQNRRAWQAHIAHVPQNIYLSDSTIEENIAFGVEIDQIDHKRVKKVAKQAQLADMIEDLKDGYQTMVGERGIRLSGGQRQRINIARALYKKADVLIFDEATSALDSSTEQEVMKAIERLGDQLTILIIAHRLTTLRGCDRIVQFDKDNLLHVGSYEDMVDVF
ncbi:ABC transporter ATP-binding protein/permease [Candidatus Thioglobus sp.]|nr:ABC transporter ATP-binding protein/permease [Candidatus Thioglobus sp.]